MPGITTWTIHIQVPTNSYSIMQRPVYFISWKSLIKDKTSPLTTQQGWILQKQPLALV